MRPSVCPHCNPVHPCTHPLPSLSPSGPFCDPAYTPPQTNPSANPSFAAALASGPWTHAPLAEVASVAVYAEPGAGMQLGGRALVPGLCEALSSTLGATEKNPPPVLPLMVKAGRLLSLGVRSSPQESFT